MKDRIALLTVLMIAAGIIFSFGCKDSSNKIAVLRPPQPETIPPVITCSDSSGCGACETCMGLKCVILICPADQSCDQNHACVSPPKTCSADSECGNCETCTESKCTALTCPDGQSCDQKHACAPIVSPPKTCSADSDCLDSETCGKDLKCAPLSCSTNEIGRNHACSPIVVNPASCNSDDACGGNEHCFKEICEALSCSAGLSPQNHICAPITDYCTTDADCSVLTGYRCNTTTNRCVSACNTEEVYTTSYGCIPKIPDFTVTEITHANRNEFTLTFTPTWTSNAGTSQITGYACEGWNFGGSLIASTTIPTAPMLKCTIETILPSSGRALYTFKVYPIVLFDGRQGVTIQNAGREKSLICELDNNGIVSCTPQCSIGEAYIAPYGCIPNFPDFSVTTSANAAGHLAFTLSWVSNANARITGYKCYEFQGITLLGTPTTISATTLGSASTCTIQTDTTQPPGMTKSYTSRIDAIVVKPGGGTADLADFPNVTGKKVYNCTCNSEPCIPACTVSGP